MVAVPCNFGCACCEEMSNPFARRSTDVLMWRPEKHNADSAVYDVLKLMIFIRLNESFFDEYSPKAVTNENQRTLVD